MKANPMPEVVRHFRDLVDGIDLASAGEMDVALAAGMRPELLSFAGPGKTPAELERAVAAGVVINMESPLEMRRIADIARRTGTRPKVAVRVNPDFELKTSGMKMAGGPKQFGVDAESVPQLLTELATLPLEFWGFHIYSGSQNLRPEILVESQQKTAALAIELARHAPAPVRMLNLGGGFGIPYFPGEQPLDLAPIGSNLRTLVPQIRAALPQAAIALELGRYLVGESGVYVCRVIDKKISRGHTFLVTDGGLHHHLAASGNFGQVIRKNYPVLDRQPSRRCRNRDGVGGRAAMHAARPAGRPHGAGRGTGRRPRRSVSVRGLRLHRQSRGRSCRTRSRLSGCTKGRRAGAPAGQPATAGNNLRPGPAAADASLRCAPPP